MQTFFEFNWKYDFIYVFILMQLYAKLKKENGEKDYSDKICLNLPLLK